MITIRMEFGQEFKYETIKLYPGFVKVVDDGIVKLIPYNQVKHISYSAKDYETIHEEGITCVRLITKPTTKEKTEVKKIVATKKK